MGTPDFAAGILKALLEAGYSVRGCVAQPDRPRGRKKIPLPGPVSEMASAYGIPLLQPEKVRRNPEALSWIAEREPDLIVVAAFGQILPKELLALPKYGCVNVHASLLPAYRGAAPIQHAILDGCGSTGVTIMQMDEGLDTGDILAGRTVPILPDETGGSLFDKMKREGAELLLETLPRLFRGEIIPLPQPEQSTTAYAGMLSKEDGLIDFSEAADVILRKVRALNPWPSAYTFLDGKLLKIWEACEASEKTALNPGRILISDGEMLVGTGSGPIRLVRIQLEGKKQMDVRDFLRGFRLQSEFLGKQRS